MILFGDKGQCKNSIHEDKTLELHLHFSKSQIAGKQENGSEFHMLENKPLKHDLW